MKLGILTFHAQLNYGGVLQAFALQLALMRAGYDVQIVDRRFSSTNGVLGGPWSALTWKSRLVLLLRVVLGLGFLGRLLRHRRTADFIGEHLYLTREHFVEWLEPVAQQVKVDCLVVGSDQVWHVGDWGDPRPYLLEGAPKISAIAYAASFGMRQIPKEMETLYREGFRRFSAISVREAEGMQLVESMAAQATHVVDPTLLLEPTVWREQVAIKKRGRLLLTVYVLSENVDALLPKLEFFTSRTGAEVHVLVNNYARPFPKTPRALVRHLCWLLWCSLSPVKLCLSAGPQEFLDAFAQADWVLSDSFHALMFSAIFNKQVAILRPESDERKAMFARIEEFVEAATEGSVIEDSVETALARFERGKTMAFRHDVIQARREASWAWLKAALEKVEGERAGMRSSSGLSRFLF